MELLQSMPLETIGYAFLGGLLPALVWLYFLLKEDERCPEPLPLIILAFVAGIICVPLALPLEAIAKDFARGTWAACASANTLCMPIITSWAFIEEFLKYAICALVILWRKDVDEAIDIVVYMLTVALGFAALENTLFLLAPFSTGQILAGISTGNLRFIGSTLLHVVASSAIGFSMAFTYGYSKAVRTMAAAIGFILAVALHALFNFFIIQGDGTTTLFAFLLVWTSAVIFFALFEILRYFKYRNLPPNTCLPDPA